MTDTDLEANGADGLPRAEVRRRRSLSLVWVVPIVAALIGAWLVFKALSEKGPEITIAFKSAEGLEAGKTKVRYKDVDIGQVTAIELSEDLKGVLVRAALVRDAERLISENTRFWVVRARVSASAIYGLGTVFSGAYIDLDPGPPGKPARHFTGLEEPPVVTTGMPGRHFLLESERRESIEIGSPVYFRQIRVGEVVSFHLSEDGSKIVSKIFVHDPYHRFVRRNTRFWFASGLDVRIDSAGIRVRTESLVSLLAGGIAFDTFLDPGDGREEAPEGAVFRLHAGMDAAKEREYDERDLYVLLFDESVRGLSRGAPLEFRGLQVGKVIDIKTELDLASNRVRIPVVVALETDRIALRERPKGMETREALLAFLVERGLRAQLRTASLLTGQLYVALDFFPKAPPARISPKGPYGYPEFPTTPTPFEEIGAKLNRLVDHLDRMPFDEIGRDLRATIKGARRVADSPELVEAVQSLNGALKELRELVRELRAGAAPELTATLEEARRALAAAQATLAADSPVQARLNAALDELAAAARALRTLADYLERHPEAALFGKGKEK
ncbi:MAG: MlaD family protein [Desulfobacterales bacterium]